MWICPDQPEGSVSTKQKEMRQRRMSTQFSSIVGTPVSTSFVSEVGACSKAVLYHRIDGERCIKMKLLCVRT